MLRTAVERSSNSSRRRLNENGVVGKTVRNEALPKADESASTGKIYATLQSSDGYKIGVNALYLAQYSDFLRCAFYGPQTEYVERRRRKVRFVTIRHDPLLMTLNFLKKLTIASNSSTSDSNNDINNKSKKPKSRKQKRELSDRLTLSTALEILDVAAYLQIEVVLKDLTEQICQKVTTDTILHTYRKAEKRYPPLADRLWKMAVEEFNVLVKSQVFVELTADELVRMLKEPKLNLERGQELPVVIKWFQENCIDLYEDAGAGSVRQLRAAVADHSRVTFGAVVGIGFYAGPRVPQSVLLAVGGWAGGGPIASMEFYEPNRRKWLPVMPGARLACEERRSYHSVAAADGELYVLGGYDGRRHHKEVLKLNLDTWEWSEVAPMNEQRCYVSSAFLDDNHLVALGGFNNESRLKTAEIFTIDRNQWSPIETMNMVRSDGDCVNVGGRIYAVGGFNGQSCHNTCEVYDPDKNHWTMLGRSMRFKRSGVKATCSVDRVLVVVGGFTGNLRLKTPEFYDPREGLWHMLADMTNKRSNFGIETINSRIVVCGGYNNVTTTSLCEAFEWRANKWLPLPEMTFSRSALAVCRIDRHPLIEQIVQEYDHGERLPAFV